MLYLDNVEIADFTGLNELTEEESLEVYPNPAVTSTNLDLVIAQPSDVSVRVMDMLGRTIDNITVGTNLVGNVNYTLDVSNYDNGTYVMYVKVGDREAVRKVNVAE